MIETPSNGSPVGRAAVWARCKGNGKRRPVILHSHLDVVPASPSEWVVPPFEGLVGGGYVVGRGALDAKGITVVQLLALLQIARRDAPLDRDVILLATPDEETGGATGRRLHRARAPRAAAGRRVPADGGRRDPRERAADADGLGRRGDGEDALLAARHRARGTPGHSSSEPRDAAVPRLIAALERIRNFESDYRVVPEVARMFAALAPLRARRGPQAALGPRLLARTSTRRSAGASSPTAARTRWSATRWRSPCSRAERRRT